MTNRLDEQIEFESPAGIVRFDGIKFGLVSVDGLGGVSADIQSQTSPFQDGVTFIDAVLAARHVDVEFIVRGKDYAEVKKRRAELARITNPKLGVGTLRYISGDIIREIGAIADGVPFFPDGDNRGERWQRGTITFECPSPYWQSPTTTEEPAFEPRFRFPIPFYDNPGKFIMGIQRDQRIINNDGDAPAPLQIEFFGPALNPKIINNTTGEFIKVNQELLEGERMLIDTTDGQKSVFFVSESGERRNVFNWIDLESTFFKLQVGENDIEYTADSDIQGAIVNISYSKLYTAV
ncbi:phage tail family protein [Lederbergia citri]|uniref:Phage tail family protein n=1 Tax=Lederbergia citri TaxID=2833580 RepID=A0A942TCU2_9BACI|nr:phage tail family protein [Lederbergia citri]MBS4195325.1 phage tail family protein [Lederbergia citri]